MHKICINIGSEICLNIKPNKDMLTGNISVISDKVIKIPIIMKKIIKDIYILLLYFL